ncbi:MAG TPA: hypothetical protein VGL58_17980, partial [Caulobacteraceae bacterium]
MFAIVMRLRCWLAVVGLTMAGLATASAARAAPVPPDDCHIGVYRLADGRIVDIAPSEPGTLRWRSVDGATGALSPAPSGGWTSHYGWTGRPDGMVVRFGDCASGTLQFGSETGRRIALDTTDTTFAADGV